MTGQKITPFLFEGEITVRVIDENGNLAWATADVCRALGILNPTDAVKDLDDDEKGLASIYTLGGQQRMSVLYESGLYALIFKSRKPNAARFRKWVTAEVLPALRQHGVYSLAPSGSLNTVGLRKPYGEWSIEEIRVALAQVNTAYRTLSPGAAAWMWERVGLPMPPKHLLPLWRQGDLLGRSFGISS